jgi:hypothetical protein
MKKLMFLCAFVFTASMMSAQTISKKECASMSKAECAKKCTKAQMSAKMDAETKVASDVVSSEADMAAEKDEAVERRVCEISGSVGYYTSKTCDVSGKTTFKEVFYDSEAKSFVGSNPMTRVASDVKVAEKPAAKKACCASKAGKKTCGSKKTTEL